MIAAGTGSGVAGSGGAPAADSGAGAAGQAGRMAGAAGEAGTAGSSIDMCEPEAETCDNRDNDCDEKIDEGVPPRACGKNAPPCRQGTQACVAGVWSTECTGEVKPGREVCDGVDNDCNGTADEGCDCTNGEFMTCGSSNAPCRQGRKVCTDGSWPTTCEGEVKGTNEVCDGMDNDCDGSADTGGNALCTGGRKCAGSSGCVECMTNTDCQGRSAPTCQVNYCNTSTHQCSQRAAEQGASCTGVPNGKCSGTKCVACIGSGDCPSGYDCQSDACVKRALCGDGTIDGPGETCEIGARSSGADGLSSGTVYDAWSCDGARCTRRYDHTPCESDAQCGSGGRCLSGNCTPTCDSSAPQLPDPTTCSSAGGPIPSPCWNCELSNGHHGLCISGGACLATCKSNWDCPFGLPCKAYDKYGYYMVCDVTGALLDPLPLP
jgi:Notch 1